ncbi:actin-domain-containing protein, partial [Rhodotorula sp. JG-1b]
LVLDNGAHSIKAAWADPAHPSLDPQVLLPVFKTAKRNYVADQLESECDDFGGLTFRVPFDHGILNNWDVQKTVWDRVYGDKGKGLAITPQETNLLLTEPVMNLPNVQEHYDQIVFEEYDFASYLRCPAPALVPYGLEARGFPNAPPPECALVIDSGFSFTHIVPVLRGRVVSHAVKRIDVGGKLLTNYLKELVSFRHWYMMDQTSVMEHAKEKACYVSTQWDRDWELATHDSNNPIVRTYVLPDFVPTSTNKLGYVRTATATEEEEQLLHLCNERFSVPEVLFTPSTIDMNQAGIAETVAACISLLPESLQGLFWSNVVCVGGNVAFEGFAERLRTDLRSFAPQEFDVNVTVSAHPTTAAASAAASYLSLPPTSPLRTAYPTPLDLSSFVTRQEYQEQGGSNACRRKFGR